MRLEYPGEKIEFLRERLVLLHALLADDGTRYKIWTPSSSVEHGNTTSRALM